MCIQLGQPRLHLLNRLVRQIFQLHTAAVVQFALQCLDLGQTSAALVMHHYHPGKARMQIQHEHQTLGHIQVIKNTAHAVQLLQRQTPAAGHTGKQNRYIGKTPLPHAQGKIQRIVVGNDDGIGRYGAVFGQ